MVVRGVCQQRKNKKEYKSSKCILLWVNITANGFDGMRGEWLNDRFIIWKWTVLLKSSKQVEMLWNVTWSISACGQSYDIMWKTGQTLTESADFISCHCRHIPSSSYSILFTTTLFFFIFCLVAFMWLFRVRLQLTNQSQHLSQRSSPERVSQLSVAALWSDCVTAVIRER